MANNTTYYWRVDEKNSGGTTTGNVWSFTTIVAAPGQASSPSPGDTATGVGVNDNLSWTAGSGAASHDVYFGTESPGEYKGEQAGTTYNTGVKANNTTYYWRIDEKNAAGTTTGIVWSFTTVAATRTLTASSTDGGNVTTPGEGAFPYTDGTNADIVAAADAYNHFVTWSGTAVTAGKVASPTSSATTVLMDADYTVIANFALDTYTLTYTAGANGSISGSSPQTVSHGGSGTAVTAVPNTNYHFVNWSDGSTANPRTDTGVTASISVTANFAINTHTVTFVADPTAVLQGRLFRLLNTAAASLLLQQYRVQTFILLVGRAAIQELIIHCLSVM